MSSKQVLRLVGVLAGVLLLWGAVALASRRSEGNGDYGSILPRLDTAAIDTIALTGPRDTAVLARQGSRWQVNGHPAEPAAVGGLLEALVDSAGSADLIARNPTSHARLRVTEDSARRVRIASGGRTVADLLAGKQTSDWGGMYLRRTGEPEVYVIRGELPRALERSSDEWRDRTIATLAPDSVSRIEIRRGRRSYTLLRKDAGWAFSSGASADSSAVADLLSSYKEVKAAGFATATQADSLQFRRLRRQARLLASGGTPLLTLEFDSISSGIWVRALQHGRPIGRGDVASGAGREREVYRLDSWTADRLTPPDSTLR